jgi:hypothetical protein
MFKTVLGAALFVAAAPALAQAPDQGPPSAPPPEFIQAAQAFGECIGGAIGAAASTLTPEAAADQAVAGCAQQRTALDGAFASWSATFPEAVRAMAQEQFRSRMGNVQSAIAAEVRRRREAPAPAPAPGN